MRIYTKRCWFNFGSYWSISRSNGCAVWGAGLDRSYTGARVRIPLKAWMFVRVFLCCVVLCRWKPCDELISRPRSLTICRNRLGNQKIRGGELDSWSQWRRLFYKPYCEVQIELYRFCQKRLIERRIYTDLITIYNLHIKYFWYGEYLTKYKQK
jgi:hypothetical protein